jgi:pSer/pThr/pTyr-binding forkhead associated (FHA) protein
MIKCQFCQTSHVANTIFCNECGNYLLADDKRETDPLDVIETGWVDDTTDEAETVSSARQDIRRLALRLKIGTSERQVEVPLNKIIHMGRVDPASSVFPEIDLTEDDILNKGVSRRHARILKQGNGVVVEDLGSINGTFINGKRLAPYLPAALSSGDVLQLGRLSLEVKILRMH